MKRHITGFCIAVVILAVLFTHYSEATGAPSVPGNDTSVQTAGMEFVMIKGGCFQMGDTFGDGESDEKPVHEVCVSDFYLGKYEVTQSQWEIVMGKNPSEFTECGPDCPVDSVSWDMAQEYIKKLNSASTIQYRLPTEAEWEYAARSEGKYDKYAGTSNQKDLPEYAWFEENAGEKTHRVGQKRPNALGLHDMNGNVWEWVADIYDEAGYSIHAQKNPLSVTGGGFRVLRGGGMTSSAEYLRTSERTWDGPESRSNRYGFRMVRIH